MTKFETPLEILEDLVVLKNTQKEINRSINNIIKEHKNALKDWFKIQFEELFKTHQKLRSFSWPQYAPSWNDGDPCYFSVRVSSLTINECYGEETDEDTEKQIMEEYKLTDDELHVIDKAISTVLKAIHDDDFIQAFGESSTITVSYIDSEVVIKVDDYCDY